MLRRERMIALLVDDEEMLRFTVRSMLQRMGYVVLEAGDGVEGLEVSRSFVGDIHLVVSDVVMPRMEGPEMLKQITAERPGISSMLMTGFVLANGDYPNLIRKPFRADQFRAKLTEILGKSAVTLTACQVSQLAS